jgi:hypothetical protein
VAMGLQLFFATEGQKSNYPRLEIELLQHCHTPNFTIMTKKTEKLWRDLKGLNN